MKIDMTELQKWVGKVETTADQITPFPMAALAATLDIDRPTPKPGDALPPLWHWLYFLPIHRHSELGSEGHSIKGGFLPPVPLPRRMWAGGRFEFRQPLRVGQCYTRTSRIQDVLQKEGRTGPLVFVVVRHEIKDEDGIAVAEEQDIVYRHRANPGDLARATQPAPKDALWQRTVCPDAVLLFRYSALTFNAHRIHYDYPYATHVEGYPGLVVHGPLIATLLLDLLRRNLPQANVTRFAFRAVSALFETAPFTVCSKPEGDSKNIALWAQDDTGRLTTTATATTS